jgi:hypothetical protein
MLKGIFICAVGHPYYGKMAYNLAVSIKAVESIPVTVVYTNQSMSHLSQAQLAIFDHRVKLPEGVPVGCGSKLWAYDLSPYNETLLLDADMLWLPKRKPSELFDELSEVKFTSITEGYWTENDKDINERYFFWADPKEIAEVYKVDKVYQWRSETIYFKKDPVVKKVFKTAQKVFLNSKLKSEAVYATGTADELGINVATAVHNIHPHEYKWKPAYWHLLNKGHYPEFSALYSNYYLASFGANVASGESRKFSDRIMKAACYKLGSRHVFPLLSKRGIIPERMKM